MSPRLVCKVPWGQAIMVTSSFGFGFVSPPPPPVLKMVTIPNKGLLRKLMSWGVEEVGMDKGSEKGNYESLCRKQHLIKLGWTFALHRHGRGNRKKWELGIHCGGTSFTPWMRGSHFSGEVTGSSGRFLSKRFMWSETCFKKIQLIELETGRPAGEWLQWSIIFWSLKLSILLVEFGDMLPCLFYKWVICIDCPILHVHFVILQNVSVFKGIHLMSNIYKGTIHWNRVGFFSSVRT